MHVCSIFTLAQGRKAQLCGLFIYQSVFILTLNFFVLLALSRPNFLCHQWIDRPPLKVTLIYILNNFIISTASLLRDRGPGRIWQGVVEYCKRWRMAVYILAHGVHDMVVTRD